MLTGCYNVAPHHACLIAKMLAWSPRCLLIAKMLADHQDHSRCLLIAKMLADRQDAWESPRCLWIAGCACYHSPKFSTTEDSAHTCHGHRYSTPTRFAPVPRHPKLNTPTYSIQNHLTTVAEGYNALQLPLTPCTSLLSSRCSPRASLDIQSPPCPSRVNSCSSRDDSHMPHVVIQNRHTAIAEGVNAL